jgi:hypothetical protein
VTLDGITTSADNSAAFRDDGIFFTGLVDAYTTRVISSCNWNPATPTNSNDGLVSFPDVAGHVMWIGPGCVFSYNNRIGLQLATDGTLASINGTAAEPVVVKGNLWTYAIQNPALGFWFDDNADTSVKLPVSYLVVAENQFIGIQTNFADAGGQQTPALQANHVASVSNYGTGFAIATETAAPQNHTFTNTTLVHNGLWPGSPQLMNPAGTGTGTISFTNSIIAGKGVAGNTSTGENLIQVDNTTLGVSFTNCGFPASGTYAVASAGTGPGGKYDLDSGAPAPAETAPVTADPSLQNVSSTNYGGANYLAVAAGAYAAAGTGGSNLSGYGPYTGPAAGVGEWSLY